MTTKELQVNCQGHGLEILVSSLCASYVQQIDYLSIHLHELGRGVIIEIQIHPCLETWKDFKGLMSIWVMVH
jgi:hypothetical protein